MVVLDAEVDAEVLRQIVLLQEQQIERLEKKLAQLIGELARLRGTPEAAQALLLEALEQVEVSTQGAGIDDGASQEGSAPQSDSEGAEAAAPADPAGPGEAPRRKTRERSGPRDQSRLARVQVLVPLSQEQLTCSVCGGDVDVVQDLYETSEVITVVRRQYFVQEICREKGRCGCNANMVTAPCPAKLVPGGRYSIDFALQIACDKYLQHLPLDRQRRMMEIEGVEITVPVLWDQLCYLEGHVRPSAEAIWTVLMDEPVLHVDETGWPNLSRSGSKSYSLLIAAAPDLVAYRILTSKSEDEIRSALEGSSGTLVADGYAVYEALARDGPGAPRLANCWAHVFRKFEAIRESFPRQTTEILDLIGLLFGVEKSIPAAFPGDASSQELRCLLREEKSRVLLGKIRRWALAQGGLHRSELGKAIRYMLKRWDGLTLFLQDARVPLDNNHGERGLRGPVVGRKNHYGSKSRRGTKVAATFYTLLESARLQGIDPIDYLRAIVLRAIETPGAVLLPADFKAQHSPEAQAPDPT